MKHDTAQINPEVHNTGNAERHAQIHIRKQIDSKQQIHNLTTRYH